MSQPWVSSLTTFCQVCSLNGFLIWVHINNSAKWRNVNEYFCSPEQQLLNAAYAEVIEQLNSQLSEKADTQITLNETKNEIQSTKEKIAQVHSARKDLQDNLIRKKKIFEETKKMLEKQVLKVYPG